MVTSNRESGFGRYDVMLKPLHKDDDGIILEFKVHNPKEESNLEETVAAALKQIEEKRYDQTLLNLGVKKENIRKYDFAFEGKDMLIGVNLCHVSGTYGKSPDSTIGRHEVCRHNG